MIVVKIELHSVVTKRITTLGQMVICNTGGTLARRNYSGVVANKRDAKRDPSTVYNDPESATRTGTLEGFPSVSYSVWRLVARMLLSAFPEERK